MTRRAVTKCQTLQTNQAPHARHLTRPCPASRPRSLFAFTRINNKSLGGADLAMMASNVVLSALSILPYDQVGSSAVWLVMGPHKPLSPYMEVHAAACMHPGMHRA